MLVLLLSTAWLFGPLSSGEAELRAGAAYLQSSETNAEGRTVETQRIRTIVGADVGITERLTIGLQIPYEWAQHIDQGQLFYRRSELGDVDLDLRMHVYPAWQLGLALRIPGHNRDDALAQRFPENHNRFPGIGSEQLWAGGFINLRASRGIWLNAGRAALNVGFEDQEIATHVQAYSLVRLFEGWLSIGPALELDIHSGDLGMERYRLGLLERIGAQSGWAFELFIHTDVATVNVPASTGANASLVWRQ